tara:strand:+ start:877 stop:2502 length:1626 start_codon:yes stop_codon:yes gene_type:complete
MNILDYVMANPNTNIARQYGVQPVNVNTDMTFRDLGLLGLSMTPIVGDAMAAKEAYDELSKANPNYLAGGLLAGAALAGAVPFVGDVAAQPLRAAGRKVAQRLNQRGSMPTTYSNPIFTRKPKPPTKEDSPMVAHHNINLRGLELSSQSGGTPMPSIAISNAKFPMEDFGDISLLLNPSKVSPSSSFPVYKADAYTGRQPRAFKSFANEAESRKKLREDPTFGHMGSSWLDSTNNFEDANYMMKVAQYGHKNKLSNPKDFDSMRDYFSSVEVKMGMDRYDRDTFKNIKGLEEYGSVNYMIDPEELFTPAGIRRDPKRYTAEEALKRMKKKKSYKAGFESVDRFGGGEARALLSSPFKSKKEIEKSRGLLIEDANELVDVKGPFSSKVQDGLEDLHEEFSKLKPYDGINTFRTTEAYISDLARGADTSWADATPKIKEKALKILEDLRKEVVDMPTHYFEAKPKSILEIKDFDAAVVPEGMENAVDLLVKAGIPREKIKTYVNDMKGKTRKDMIQKFKELMFAAPFAGLLGANMMLPNQEDL